MPVIVPNPEPVALPVRTMQQKLDALNADPTKEVADKIKYCQQFVGTVNPAMEAEIKKRILSLQTEPQKYIESEKLHLQTYIAKEAAEVVKPVEVVK